MDLQGKFPRRGDNDGSQQDRDKAGRPFLSIYWRCCSVYSRVYKGLDGTAYEGLCPRCRRQLTVPVGEGGTNQRTFIAE